MDDQDKNPEVERSAEEIAWDEEFTEARRDTDVVGTLGDLARLVVQVPIAIVQMPMNMLPQETRRHARAAVREGFLAVRSLLSAVGDGIEEILTEPATGGAPTTVRSGPPGTWGTAPSEQSPFATGTLSSSKVKRIQLSEEEGTGDAQFNTSPEDAEPRESRGMRADIDY
ncbi:MAG TPA: hypothetical protein VGE45_02230 [Chloroflexia bacterium]